MEIVIKIDDEQYNIICEKITSIREEIRKNGYAKNDIVPLGWPAIVDGIQLPEEHGDLIDRDVACEELGDISHGDDLLRYVPTVIKADRRR